MNPPQPQPRRYSRTMPPFVLLFTTTLMFFQVTQAQNGNNDSANYYYPNDGLLFPRPNTSDKTVLEPFLSTIPPDTSTLSPIPLTLSPIPSTSSSISLSSSPIPSTSSLPISINECVCVKFWLCPNKTIVTGGEGVIDIRLNINNTCPSYLDRCCNYPGAPEPTLIMPTKENRQPCGNWNSRGVGFKIKGNTNNETDPGEFPWMVVILKLVPDNKTHELYCSGSLIHPKVVLTAAHCLPSSLKLEELIIRAGEWDLKEDQELNPHQDREVLRFVKHEKYSKGTGANDIGLIFLTEPFILKLHISTICLPPQGFEFRESNKDNCKVTGWGSNNQGVYQYMLKKIDVSIVRHDVCEVKLGKYFMSTKYKLQNSFICAGGMNGEDACKGDGGGPLVCPLAGNSTRFHQAGIVSWGIGCGIGYPGLYTDVSQFREWIDQQMIGLDRSYYDENYAI